MSLEVLSDHSRLDNNNNNRAFIAFLKYIITVVLLLFPPHRFGDRLEAEPELQPHISSRAGCQEVSVMSNGQQDGDVVLGKLMEFKHT